MQKQEYILESKFEGERLHYQASHKNYDPISDLQYINISLPKESLILDAGCGNGLVSTILAEKNPESVVYAVDNSKERLKEANTLAQNKNIRNIILKNRDLRSTGLLDESMDIIICRFVFEHTKNIAQEISNHLFQLLKTGGKLVIIDTDGLFYHLDTENSFLSNSLLQLKNSDLNFSSNICKQIPRFLNRSGFKNKNINIHPKPILFFEESDRFYEYTLCQMRLTQLKPNIGRIIGKNNVDKFINSYLEEILNPENFIYYQKFIFEVTKK